MDVINMPLVFKVCMGQVGNGNLGNNFNWALKKKKKNLCSKRSSSSKGIDL